MYHVHQVSSSMCVVPKAALVNLALTRYPFIWPLGENVLGFGAVWFVVGSEELKTFLVFVLCGLWCLKPL
jgi:hypothetical protein